MKQTLECWSSTKKPPINDKKLRSRELWRSANKRLTPFATSQSSQKRLISRDLLLYLSSPLLYPCTYSLLLYLLFVSNCACFSFCLNVHLRVFVFCYFVLLFSFLPFWNILSILSLRPCLFFFSQFVSLWTIYTPLLLFVFLSLSL